WLVEVARAGWLSELREESDEHRRLTEREPLVKAPGCLYPFVSVCVVSSNLFLPLGTGKSNCEE
ncbi:MAG TPA: hypothetical protein VGJ12_08800, partial [Gemmatimonadaceae bacterium]